MGDKTVTIADNLRRRDPQRPHDQLSDRYRPGDELARGGMGRVLEARDMLLGRTVAVKQALELDADALRRFKRETLVTARLEHPSIVPVYDAGTAADGSPFYVMRKVSGRPLDELVAAADTLNQRLALLPQLVAAAQAVAHAHRRGVIHRDLKPGNILVGDLGETMVIDWGLAKVLDDVELEGPATPAPLAPDDPMRTNIGAVFGTPGFMSPQQLERSSDVDERADVYALGATLYYLLARESPHHGPSAEDTVANAMNGPPTPVGELVRGVPAELATIVDKALAYDDRERYRDAGALAEDLQRFLTGQLVASHRYTAIERVGRFVRRNRVAVAVVALALASLAVVALIAVGRVIDARDDALAQRAAADAARRRETERATDAILDKARRLLDENPTHAVATVKSLAASDRWREVRAIAADARSAGVAWRLPGPAKTISVALSPDGLRAVASGMAGEIWSYDLTARTGRQLVELGDVFDVAYPDAQHAIAYGAKVPRIVVIDLATAATRELAIAAAIRRPIARAGTLFWTDHDGHAWRFRATDDRPEPIAVADKISRIMPSPDGTRVALGGEHQLWLAGAGALEALAPGSVTSIAWEGDRLDAILGDDIVTVTLAPQRAIRHGRLSGEATVLLHHGVRYMVGLAGVFVDDKRLLRMPDNFLFELHATAGGAVVTAAADGTITLVAGEHYQQLASPFSPLGSIVASASSPFVISINRGAVLLWNVAPMLPVRLDGIGEDFGLTPVGSHAVVAVGFAKTADMASTRWIDLERGASVVGPDVPRPIRMTSSRDGTTLVSIDEAGEATLARRGRTDRAALAHGVDHAWFVDDGRVVIVTKAGELRVHDVATGRTSALFQHPGPVTLLRATPVTSAWLVAGFADGTLARIEIATGQLDILATARAWKSNDAIITSRGDVWLLDRGRVERWSRDGARTQHGDPAIAIAELIEVDDHHAIGAADRGDVYAIDLDSPGAYDLIAANADRELQWAPRAKLLVVRAGRDGTIVVDELASARFRVARLLGLDPRVAISDDGRFLFARIDSNIAVWPLELPDGPRETAAWLDSLTNATTGRREALTWP